MGKNVLNLCLQVNIHLNKSKYTQDGPDVEIILDRKSSYNDILDNACTNLGISKKKGYRLSLFTCGGAMILESGGWTLGGYLRDAHRSSMKTRFGIGHVKLVSIVHAFYG